MPDPNAELLVVYRPVVDLHQALRRWQGTWADHIATARASSIEAIVGIWEGIRTKHVHILRKHPGLNMLSDMECGNQSEEDFEGDD